MTTIDRSGENHRLIGLRLPLRRRIVRATADVGEIQPSSPGHGLGESNDGGTGSAGDAST